MTAPFRQILSSRWVYGLYLAVAVVVLLEIALRIVAPFDRDLATMLYLPGVERSYGDVQSLEELMQTTVLGFVPQRLRCGFVLNSRSMRTKEYALGEPKGRRIVTIGDSFNFDSNGVRYDDMFSSVLERRLRAEGQPVDVFALGVPGVGPRFELRLWQLEKPLLRPEQVIVSFFVGNDFTDETRLGRRQRLSDGLARGSVTFRLVRNLRRRPEIAPVAGDPRRETGGYAVDGDDFGNLVLERPELVAIEAQRLRLALTRHRSELERLAEAAGRVLVRFRDDVEASGARFLVMLVPDVYQVDDALLGESLASLGLGRRDVDLHSPQRALIAHLEAHGVEHLDLLPELRTAAASGEQLYWPYDTHWNEAGHRLAGELLARRLTP